MPPCVVSSRRQILPRIFCPLKTIAINGPASQVLQQRNSRERACKLPKAPPDEVESSQPLALF
jgi:hypothetical protein